MGTDKDSCVSEVSTRIRKTRLHERHCVGRKFFLTFLELCVNSSNRDHKDLERISTNRICQTLTRKYMKRQARYVGVILQ